MIQDLKDLQKLLKLCRAQGITEIKLQGVEIKFGDLPNNNISMGEVSTQDPLNPYANFPQGELTQDQLAFYSSGGRPEDDPMNKDAI